MSRDDDASVRLRLQRYAAYKDEPFAVGDCICQVADLAAGKPLPECPSHGDARNSSLDLSRLQREWQPDTSAYHPVHSAREREDIASKKGVIVGLFFGYWLGLITGLLL